jgi:DNA recombination-dependent growth factor C
MSREVYQLKSSKTKNCPKFLPSNTNPNLKQSHKQSLKQNTTKAPSNVAFVRFTSTRALSMPRKNKIYIKINDLSNNY